MSMLTLHRTGANRDCGVSTQRFELAEGHMKELLYQLVLLNVVQETGAAAGDQRLSLARLTARRTASDEHIS